MMGLSVGHDDDILLQACTGFPVLRMYLLAFRTPGRTYRLGQLGRTTVLGNCNLADFTVVVIYAERGFAWLGACVFVHVERSELEIAHAARLCAQVYPVHVNPGRQLIGAVVGLPGGIEGSAGIVEMVGFRIAYGQVPAKLHYADAFFVIRAFDADGDISYSTFPVIILRDSKSARYVRKSLRLIRKNCRG